MFNTVLAYPYYLRHHGLGNINGKNKVAPLADPSPLSLHPPRFVLPPTVITVITVSSLPALLFSFRSSELRHLSTVRLGTVDSDHEALHELIACGCEFRNQLPYLCGAMLALSYC